MNPPKSPTYAIAKTLEDKGYQVADAYTSIRTSEPRHDVLGILKPREPIKRSFLGFKWTRKQRALYIGTLWVDNEARMAKPGENWVLEVNGRDNISKLTELVKQLSDPKKVSVQVRLDTEQPELEGFVRDYLDSID